ncbi:hypothetical protein ACFQOZ_11570 [Comamonas endophytica]|uniref:hypothetical protein n=1 Tax=Comamonas endophytica TaxID=2949090 RepID=UPI003607F19F
MSGLYLTEDHDMKYAGVNRAVNPALGQSANIVARSLADLETSGIDAHLTGRFDAYGRRHELVSGMNYTRTTNDTTYGFRTNYNIFNIGSYDPALREPWTRRSTPPRAKTAKAMRGSWASTTRCACS